MATRSSIPSAFAGLARTASLGATGSIAHHKHQMGTDTERGLTLALWLCRLAPAAYEPQDCERLGRGNASPVLFRISQRLVSSPSRRPVSHPLPRGTGHNSPVRAVTGCAGAFIQYDQSGSRRPVVHSMPAKQTSQSIAYRCHSSSLSSAAAFAGSQPSEALNGRVPNSSGAFQKTEGELPNVCC